ncbi:MAG: methyltransferase domain-containing protein [Planctomycetota bacterium]|nr:methyltransferase domain-containing protein [Planctomycetota bacterium]
MMETCSTSPPSRNYDLLANCYDLLAATWSGGAIRTARLWCAGQLDPEQDVLVVGPGTGEDVAVISSQGVHIVIIDLSIKMLEATLARCRLKGGIAPEVIHGDFRTQPSIRNKDAVLAPFVLNVFPSDELPHIIEQLQEYTRDGARILISDFAPPAQFLPMRLLMELWHGIPMAIFHLFTGSAWHPIHDIPAAVEQAGMVIVERKRFRVLGIGPRWIEAIVIQMRDTV